MAKGIWTSEKTFKKLDAAAMQNELAVRSVQTGSFTNWFNVLPDPDPVLKKLGNSVEIYKDLLADEHVAALVERIENEVKGMEWILQPDDGMEDDAPEIELCKQQMAYLEDNGYDIEDIISQSLSPHLWGMGVFEATYNMSSSPWLINSLQLKPAEWFKYNDNNHLLFMPKNSSEGIPITGPDAKENFKYQFFLLRNSPTYENPFGRKALSRVFWAVTFKRGGLKFFSWFVEKFGMPSVHIKHPTDWTDAEVDKLVTSAALMIQDSVIATPEGTSIEVKNAGDKSSGELYEMYLARCDKMIDKGIVLTTLATSQQEKGGYNSALMGDEVIQSIGKVLRKYPEKLFRKVFKAIVDLNIGSGRYPFFTTYDEEDAKKDFADRDQVLSQAANLSGQQIKRTKQYYIENFGYIDEHFEIVDVEKDVPTIFAEEDKTKVIDLKGENETENFLSDKLMQSLMETTLDPVFALVEKNYPKKKLMKKLADIYPKMDTTELERILTNIFVYAELLGRTDAKKEQA